MEKNVTQTRTRGPNFSWTDEFVRLLVTILIEYQKKNGSKQAYNWKDITASFTSKSGKTGVKDFCRNKFESMKKDYKAWKLLRNSETGLGWDDNTRTITASNEWWDRKIKEDVNCRKFRNKGMDIEYEELLTSLFAGNVATGRLAMSYGMIRDETPERVSLGADEGLGLGEEDGNGPEFFREFVDTVNEGGGSSYSGVPANLNDDPLDAPEIPTPLPSKANNDKFQHKRKRRQTVGSSKLEAHLTQARENSERLLSAFQDEVCSQATRDEMTVKKGLAILDGMVEKNFVEEGSPLWCFMISKTKSKNDMNIFLNLADDEKRLKWMKWEHERSV